MTDFYISAVNYDKETQHIAMLKVHEDKGSTVGPARKVPREFVADLIRLNKASFMTITKNKDSKWEEGAHVHVMDDTYLSTDKNGRIQVPSATLG